MHEIYEVVKILGSKDSKVIEKKFIKLSEEAGELAAAYLEEDGFKVRKVAKTDEELRDHILEEGVDSIMVIMDILACKEFTYEQICNKMWDKLHEWKTNIENKK